MKLLSDYAKRITDPMFDVCCDAKLTPGQTLTVLEMAKNVIDIEISRWQETVERQTEHRTSSKRWGTAKATRPKRLSEAEQATTRSEP